MIDHNRTNEQRAAFVWSKLRKRFHAPTAAGHNVLPADWQAGNVPESLDG
jgi:hypothetical protein